MRYKNFREILETSRILDIFEAPVFVSSFSLVVPHYTIITPHLEKFVPMLFVDDFDQTLTIQGNMGGV